MPGDLDGLNKLDAFDVSHNPIEEITKDFFVGHETITKISFFDCHMKKVEKGALEPLYNLKHAIFNYNDCINAQEKNKNGIPSFAANLYDKCDGKGHYIKQHKDDQCIQRPSKEFIHRSSGNVTTFMAIILIIFLLLVIIILCVTLLKIYQNYFRSNWHEMKNSLITTS